jgi:DNA-binding cell septation regulator SpoVG
MHISIEMHGDQFNVQISSKAGEDHFLAIKGCRVVSGSNGDFVSFPARKMDSGKYWTHVWASDKFQAAILKAHAAAAKAAKPAAKKAAKKADDDAGDDIPF